MTQTQKMPFQMTDAERADDVARRLAKQVELRAWRDAAIADGWAIKPTYGESEPVEQACRLTRDGYVVSMLIRPVDPPLTPMPQASINAWCPREISLDHAVTPTYDFAALVAGERTCPNCGATDVDTVRIAFANRSCAACAPALSAKYERGNWTE